jgi:hypothetical protein
MANNPERGYGSVDRFTRCDYYRCKFVRESEAVIKLDTRLEEYSAKA